MGKKVKTDKKVEKVLDHVGAHDFDLNFGLAPNTFGFSFIYNGDENKTEQKRLCKILDNLLDSLNESQVDQLRNKYFPR